jgi:hypothetical protein
MTIAEIDATVVQQGERLVGCRIITDARDQFDIRPEPLRSQCLIRALATRETTELRARDCLTRSWQVIDRGDEVEID